MPVAGKVGKIRIGDLLVGAGEITAEQLQDALAEQKRSGLKLGRILVDSGVVSEDRLLGFLSEQMGVPYIDLEQFSYDEAVVTLLPETYARRYRAVVLSKEEHGYLVGLADPTDIFAYDEISRQLHAVVSIAVVKEADLLEVLDAAYRRTSDIVSFASELDGELSVDEFHLNSFDASEDDNTPVARLLQSIFEDALQIRASDVHIEPGEQVLRLRQRVDGVLQEQILNEKRIASALVSRLKLMAGLDISEKRLPQDGRFEMNVKDTLVDVRLSSMPTIHGESVVMRLADHSGDKTQMEAIGMAPAMLERFKFLLNRPNGLILVTGPTGSGKTTTLYGGLNYLNSPEKKIITVEDPVEYQLERINQIQVKPKIGLDFARVLRGTLRQDPDILLVGEIRDAETADIALRAAITGHLVMSTLHTNDSVSSALRLIDIGVEGYMVATAVRCIVAQRLIRRICERCAESAKPEEHQQAWLNTVFGEAHTASMTFMRGRGCKQCNKTGYFGRVGVFELLEMNAELSDALRRNDAAAFAERARRQEGFVSLLQSAMDYAQQGHTTLDEVMALSGHQEEMHVEVADAEQTDVEHALETSLIHAQQQQKAGRGSVGQGGLELDPSH